MFKRVIIIKIFCLPLKDVTKPTESNLYFKVEFEYKLMPMK